MKRLLVIAGVALAAIASTWPAQAGFRYQLVDYPGATNTQVFGINDRGVAVGNGFTNVESIPFQYDTRTGLFTVVPAAEGYSETDVLGINNRGVMVGAVISLDGTTESGFIRHNDGTFTVFAMPGWANTEPRAINNHGVVTGHAFSADGSSSTGFIYDPEHNTFTTIFPSSFTIAQGISDEGQVVGHVTLDAEAAYPGSPAGLYAFRRNADGDATLFRVNGHGTRARGITESGRITGFVNDPATGGLKGFVARLRGSSAYQALSIPDANLLVFPGQLRTDPEGITEEGVVAGNIADPLGTPVHGFIATRDDD
jgi:uncharacterized membrane protein